MPLEGYGNAQTPPPNSSQVFSYGYDARGRLVSVHKNNRQVERYAYNASGQRVRCNSNPTGCSASSERELGYDDSGKLVSDGERGFCYDKHGALKEIWGKYGYTQLSYVQKTLVEKVQAAGGKQLRYEYEGIHPVSCYRYLTLYAEYQWDKQGRVVLFRDHDIALDFSFSYTPEGHVAYIRLDPMDKAYNQAFPEDTDWSEQSRDWTYFAAAITRKKRVDAFLQSYAMPLKLACACDQVGTVRLLTDPYGKVVKSITRDSFGNLEEDSFSDLFIPVGFAGGLEDKYTGFTRFGWRDYDAIAGRFMSLDPAKDARGDGDLYDYCTDDPVNKIDPTGLWTQETFEESCVSRDGQGQFSTGGDVGGPMVKASAELSGLDRATAGNTADPLVESLKIESSELKADLQQCLAGKDSAVCRDTFQKLQAQTPDNATVKERENATELTLLCIKVMPATDWVKANMWEKMPECLADEVGAMVFDDKIQSIMVSKVAEFIVKNLLKRLNVASISLSDFFSPTEANPLTPSEKKKKREKLRESNS